MGFPSCVGGNDVVCKHLEMEMKGELPNLKCINTSRCNRICKYTRPRLLFLCMTLFWTSVKWSQLLTKQHESNMSSVMLSVGMISVMKTMLKVLFIPGATPHTHTEGPNEHALIRPETLEM